jgi:hypothetical protein
MQKYLLGRVSVYVTLLLSNFLMGQVTDAQVSCYTYPDKIDRRSVKKATISLRDSVLDVTENIRKDYRVVGYSQPSLCAERWIIFSVFTRDVKENPYDCRYGAFYSTSASGNQAIVIKYAGQVKSFIRATLYVEGQHKATLYFERRWVTVTKGQTAAANRVLLKAGLK